MAASVSDVSPTSKRARKFDSKATMSQYHRYTAMANDLDLEMLYALDTMDRARGILTLSPQHQPFTKLRDVLATRLGVVRMIQHGNANVYIARTVVPEAYINFMESLGVERVWTKAKMQEKILTFLECSSMEQVDSLSQFIILHVSNARKIFQAAMKTAELIEHLAVSQCISIPPHLAVIQPRPHAAAPPPEAAAAVPMETAAVTD